MTLPIYTELEPRAITWASTPPCQLLHPDGTADGATSMEQHKKTVEEIGEASLELRKLAKSTNLVKEIEAIMASDIPEHDPPELSEIVRGVLARRRQRLATELGDVLVTLALQAAMAGSSLEECLALVSEAKTPTDWDSVDIHAKGLAVALRYPGQNPYLREFMGFTARCVEDLARINLCLSGPECLALALDKIEGRQGYMDEKLGVFVKE